MPSFRASLPRRAVAVLAASIATLFVSPALHAEIYYWDPTPGAGFGDDTLNGGAGIWNTTDANFTTSLTDSSAVAHNLWSSALNNLGTDTVIFGGAAGGTVTLNSFSPNVLTNSSILGVSNLTFDTSGYTLTGSNTIRFIGTGSITVSPGVTTTINNAMSGAGLTGYTVDTDVEINGGGTLRMGGGNNTIGFTIAAGTTVEQTGGSFSGWNLNTVNGTLRTLAPNVLPAPSGYRENGSGAGILDLNGNAQTVANLGGGLTVTNGTSANNIALGLTLTSSSQTLTAGISDGTGGGKISVFTTGTAAQGVGFQSTTNFGTQTFAGANTFTGSFSHGRGTVILDFSNTAAPTSNIFYNSGFGTTPTGDDGKLIFYRPTATNGSALGTIATLQITGKADTANVQQFRGLKLDAQGAGQIYINPNATGNTVTLDLGSTIERESGGFVNFSTSNATTALSANATIRSTAGTADSLLTAADGVAFATIGGRDWAGKNATNDEIVAVTYTPSQVTSFVPGANITTPSAGGASNDIRLGSNTAVASLRYGNSSSRTGIMLGGNTLTTGGILISTVMNSTGTFLSGGTVTSPGSDLVLAQFTGSSNRWFQMDAVIADGTGGATGFTKAGTGFTVLSQNNTFTGELTSHQGGLIVLGTNNGASAVNINGAQTNLMGQHLPTTATSGSFIQIGNSGAAGTIGSGPITIGGNAILAVKSSGAVTVENTISGFGGFTQSGTGTTTLLSAPTAKYTYIGDTTVDGGTLKLDYSASNTGIINDSSRLVLGGGTLEYATAADTTHNDVVRGFALISGATTVTKTGTGTGRLRMNNVADINIAGATVNFTAAGVADTDISSTNGILGSRARFTVGSDGTYDWAAQASNSDSPVAAYTGYTVAATSGTNTSNSRLQNSSLTLTGDLTTNTLKVESTTTGATQTVDIDAANTLTLTAGGLLVTGTEQVAINNGTLKSNTASNSDLIIHQHSTGALTIGSVIANGNGNSTLTKSGSGPLVLTGENTYTGQTFLNGGTTSISSNAALGAVGSGATLNLNNATLRVTDDVLLANGAVGTNNRNIVLNGVGGTLQVDDTKTLTVAGTISGPGGLTKAGLGTLELRSNTSTGPTNVEAGTLRYLTAVNNVYSEVTVAAGATIDLFGSSNYIASLAGAGTVTNSSTTAAATLTVGGLPSDTIFSGNLTQAGTFALGFEKGGPGVLTLTNGTNDTSGSFTVSGGTLKLTGDAVFTTRTGTGAGTVSVNSATGTLDISGITADTLSAGAIASVAGSHINLGSKTLIVGSNNGSTTLAGVISGVGGGLVKTSTAVGNGTLIMTGVNTYTGQTIIDQGVLRIRDSVLVNTPGPLGNTDSAIVVGTPTSATTTAFSSNIHLAVQPLGDNEHITIERPIDFSQAPRNATFNDRSRFRLEHNNNGIADMTKLTISGEIKLGSRSLEMYVDKSGHTLEFTGNIIGGSGATVYLTGLSSTAETGDGASGGTFRFSDMARTFSSSISLTIGRLEIAGSVPAAGNPSPVGTGNVSLSDGSGGNTLSAGATSANRAIFLENADTSYARGLNPGGGSGVTPAGASVDLYGSGQVRLMNSHQFGGMNTSGTVTYTSNISAGSAAVSVTGTAGGLGGTNPITTVHNFALLAATGGTVVFDGTISGSTAPVLGALDTPGAAGTGNLARVTINQVRNHPNIDENRDGFADDTADALVGTASAGTVVLNGSNSYGGTTEVLGGTLLVNGSIGGDTLTVQNGATLGGNGAILEGTVGSKATIKGGIAPGASTDGTGLLTIQKPLVFESGASLTLELNGIFPGFDYDQLAVGTDEGITLAGNNPINLTLGYVPAESSVITLIDNYGTGAIGGTFVNLPDNGLISLSFSGNLYPFLVDYQGGTGNDLTLTAVPEPSAAIALLAGVGALLGIRRRRW